MNDFFAVVGCGIGIGTLVAVACLLDEIAKALRAIDETLSEMDLFAPHEGPADFSRIAAALEALAGKASPAQAPASPWDRPTSQHPAPGDPA